MTDTNNAPVPPPPPPQPPAGEDLQSELHRARSRNKALKITLLLLATLLVLLGVAGYMVYRRLMQTKEAVEEAFAGFPQQTLFRAEGNAQLPLPGASVFTSTGMPASSLGLFAGGVPGAQAEAAQEQAEKILTAMNKYADRPIVKEFIADLKKNPDMAKAMADGQGGNPVAMVRGVQNARGMEKIIAKYAMRPEFMKLMMEVMSDPEMAAVTNSIPSGIRPNIGGAVPVQSVPGPGPAVRETPADQDGDGEMTLDTSAISGPAPAKQGAPAEHFLIVR